MISDATEPNSPRPKLDEEQDVEGLEPHGLHGEEVGRDDAGGLRAQNARQVTDARRGAGPSPLRSSTVRMVVADTWTPSFLSSP